MCVCVSPPAAAQLETNEEENFRQSASLVRTQTVVDAAEVSNQAIEVAEAAVAKVGGLRSRGQAAAAVASRRRE